LTTSARSREVVTAHQGGCAGCLDLGCVTGQIHLHCTLAVHNPSYEHSVSDQLCDSSRPCCQLRLGCPHMGHQRHTALQPAKGPPAVCLDSTAVGTYFKLIARICSPYPGSMREHTASVASGVTSRGEGPVPPVVTIRQQPLLSACAQKCRHCCSESPALTQVTYDEFKTDTTPQAACALT
jgi:hypothetical protein